MDGNDMLFKNNIVSQELINKLLKKFYDYGFSEIQLPSIKVTFEDNQNKYEKPDMERFGEYNENIEIILYAKPIVEYSTEKRHPKQLSEIVLIHEIAHWITHKLPFNGICWEDEKYWHRSKETTEVHECFAQLLTWWIIKDNDALKSIFEKLVESQSVEYKKYRVLINRTEEEIIKDLIEFRNLIKEEISLQSWGKISGEKIRGIDFESYEQGDAMGFFNLKE